MSKTTDETKKNITPSKGIKIAAAICIAAALLCGIIFAYAATYTKILPNVYVAGLKIGGMTADAAEQEVSKSFGNITKGREISVICCGNEKTLSFDELEFKVDVSKTVQNAYKVGRDKGVFKRGLKMLALVTKGESIDMAVDFDRAKLNKVIDQLAADKEQKPTDTEYILDGEKLIIFKGHGGKLINREQAARKLVAAATDPDTKSINLELEKISASTPDLEVFYKELTAPCKDAEYVLKDGEVIIEPEKVGIKVEKSKIKAALESGEESYSLDVETEAPKITAEELKSLLFRDTLGSFSSSFATSTQARASNVMLTANRINGKILMPGEVFSYDTAIGKRTAANGYKEAGVYIGNKVESGIGGGICQTSSTLYSAVLYSNLEIVSRTSHSLPVSYIPMGQDATIAEGYIDFKFKNNTDYPVKIAATVSGRRLTCSLLGVKNPKVTVELVNTIISTAEPQIERSENAEVPQGYKRLLNKGAKGYTVASQRIVKESGKVIKTEKLTRSVYRAAPIEEEVNPADKDTPSEQLKIYTPGMEVPPKEPEAAPPEEEPQAKPNEDEGPAEENQNPKDEPSTEETDEIVNV